MPVTNAVRQKLWRSGQIRLIGRIADPRSVDDNILGSQLLAVLVAFIGAGD